MVAKIDGQTAKFNSPPNFQLYGIWLELNIHVHPGSSTALLYLPREKGGRGLHAVETEYKVTKVKAVVRLYKNKDPAMGMVREFEERAESLSVARSIY